MPLADELLGSREVAELAAVLDRTGRRAAAEAVRGVAPGIGALALRERSDALTLALLASLPAGHAGMRESARAALRDPAFTGWMVWPVTEAVVTRALEEETPAAFDEALTLLMELTPVFTGEFAIRRLLRADLDRALAIVTGWTDHPDEHVRRLASEGTRPRLPWAVRVPEILARPLATRALLDALHHDPSEYVRRSVANHVNDISHADPALAVEIAAGWDALSPSGEHTARTVRHALRTAVKRGHPGALTLLGFTPDVQVTVTGPRLTSLEVPVGSHLDFAFEVANTGQSAARLVIDYVVHYRKATGRTNPKVFKLTACSLPPGERLTFTRRHPLKPLSTRPLHPGPHSLTLQINGTPHNPTPFTLTPPPHQ
ncbi:DNA alkylation repair protein [Actinocorallia sp. A-T 12471]|uniref:DNA alkylation repair protein n=1 Tax=Actinocorallia sp. A-T 12471 TaxID=3089813 RepID=UPI0029CB7386|nr:DNA alkylation repair protein [Actinocorallia sp. A-T 12471]MDX6742238.1 DNA alkylation repair protein [Actinocorallia sp. A-T 12471]